MGTHAGAVARTSARKRGKVCDSIRIRGLNNEIVSEKCLML